MPSDKFINQNLLSIDFGTKVIGIAQFCPGRDPFPYPWGKIVVNNPEQVINELTALIAEEAIDIIILGLPHLTDGTATKMTEQVREFGKSLKNSLDTIPIYLQDETLSSYEASERMKNSPKYNFKVDPKQIDALAATIILEDFLTSQTFCIL